VLDKKEKKKASVIIPTLNRPEQVYQLANSLMLLNSLEELIIVDQSPEPNLKLETLSQKDPRIKIIRSARKGSPHAKNIGAKEAEGDILIFLDDDVEVHGDIINAHIKAYSDPSIGAVGGRVKEEYVKKIPCRYVGKVRLLSVRVWGHYDCKKRQFIDTTPGGNMSIRKELFQNLGGFDEGFLGNAFFEETDLCLRLKKRGYKILFEPDALISHFRVAFGGNRVDQINFYFWFFANNTRLFLKLYSHFLFPFYFFLQTLRIIKLTLKNRSFGFFKAGIKGLCYSIKNNPSKFKAKRN